MCQVMSKHMRDERDEISYEINNSVSEWTLVSDINFIDVIVLLLDTLLDEKKSDE